MFSHSNHQIWYLILVHPETKIGRIWSRPRKIQKLYQSIGGRKGGVGNGSAIATILSFDCDSSFFLGNFFLISLRLFYCVSLILQQLTDALLEIEEERAIWSAKEKDALLAIEEQARSNNEQITSLSAELSEVRFIALLFKLVWINFSANTCKRKVQTILHWLWIF